MYQIYEKKRDALGLSDYKVSKDTGITQASFSQWKRGKRNPSLKSLLILADYFHCSISDFVGR